ncbi:MAG TPA: SRPBCC domain-containing protein [Acidobacteriaceae bacterium]|nr:SRPBCC domain-containing protein [Acidobacteriaceae bacterium]
MGSVMTEVKPGENLKVEIRRVIRASRQRVFAAWTKPEELKKWLAPGPMSVVSAETEPQVGGRFRMTMKGSMDGLPENAERRVSVEGEYTKLLPNELVSFTWRPDWNADGESQVTVRLRDVEGGTEMLFTHERISSADSSAGYNRGWASCFEKLNAALSR